jgi:hypothetical protein
LKISLKSINFLICPYGINNQKTFLVLFLIVYIASRAIFGQNITQMRNLKGGYQLMLFGKRYEKEGEKRGEMQKNKDVRGQIKGKLKVKGENIKPKGENQAKWVGQEKT